MKFLVLDEDIAIPISLNDRNWDGSDQDWFFIDSGVWYIKRGTIWDGATAVPDGRESPTKPGYPLLWLASLIHDLGYMFMCCDDFPYTRKEIDDIFMRLMKAVNFPLRQVYYLGVRIFGGVWERIFAAYRDIMKKERQLPGHLEADYEATEIQIFVHSLAVPSPYHET